MKILPKKTNVENYSGCHLPPKSTNFGMSARERAGWKGDYCGVSVVMYGRHGAALSSGSDLPPLCHGSCDHRRHLSSPVADPSAAARCYRCVKVTFVTSTHLWISPHLPAVWSDMSDITFVATNSAVRLKQLRCWCWYVGR